jgi:hypothetical protein
MADPRNRYCRRLTAANRKSLGNRKSELEIGNQKSPIGNGAGESQRALMAVN